MGLIPIHSKIQWLFGPRPIRSMICRVSGPGSSSEWAVITLLTELSEPADPNRNRSSSKWASFPFTRKFSAYVGLGPFAR